MNIVSVLVCVCVCACVRVCLRVIVNNKEPPSGSIFVSGSMSTPMIGLKRSAAGIDVAWAVNNSGNACVLLHFNVRP